MLKQTNNSVEVAGGMEEKAKHPVFVYGTLKRGYGAHNFIANQRFIGNGTVPGSIVDLGAFPGFVEAGPGRVRGEVFEVSREVLRNLDAYEGVPHLYRRKLVDVALEEGVIKAWIYELVDIPNNFDHIRLPHGEWDKRRPHY